MGLSLRWKITLWFGAVMALVVTLCFTAVFLVSNEVLQKGARDKLVEDVEANADEVFAYESGHAPNAEGAETGRYLDRNGFVVEVEEDFISLMNGTGVALYESDGQLLYGMNKIARETSSLALGNGRVQTVEVSGVRWYVYDRPLEGNGLEGLFLRGTVSEAQAALELSDITRISLVAMVTLLVIGVLGGYLIARRQLRPIEQISSTAKQVGETYDLTRRVDLDPGADELHELAASFDAMVEKLDSAFDAQRRLTADVSHELRTPTAIIMAQCEYTLEEERDPEEYREALETVQRQGAKLSGLVDDILEISRIRYNGNAYPFQPVDLSAVAAASGAGMSDLGVRGITLERDIEEAVQVQGNATLLQRLVDNIVANAFRYGIDGGHVLISLHRHDGSAVLSVADDGIGIAQEDLERIFDRFYQSDRARTGVGSGLGLALAKQIAELHEGTISVESELGRGSTFTVRLPCLDQDRG